MARGRMLNRAVAIDGRVAAYGEEFGPLALVFHHRAISFLDKNGNMRADPAWLKAQVMPLVAEIDPEGCRTLAAGLVKHDLAVIYEQDGLPYLHFPKFRENQVGLRHEREAAEAPVPAGFNEASGTLPDSFRTPSGYEPEAFRKASRVKEGNRTERKREGGTTPPSLRRGDDRARSEAERAVAVPPMRKRSREALTANEEWEAANDRLKAKEEAARTDRQSRASA